MADRQFNPQVTAEVHQATGMIAAQLNCDPLEALAQMIVRARDENIALDELARDVIDRRVKFSQPHG